MKNILFICTKNRWRSPTAETLYKNQPDINARSRGTSKAAKQALTTDDIIWANTIVCMEQKHKCFIIDQFRPFITHQSILVLDIPDEYQYMDKELVEWLIDSIDSYLLTD